LKLETRARKTSPSCLPSSGSSTTERPAAGLGEWNPGIIDRAWEEKDPFCRSGQFPPTNNDFTEFLPTPPPLSPAHGPWRRTCGRDPGVQVKSISHQTCPCQAHQRYQNQQDDLLSHPGPNGGDGLYQVLPVATQSTGNLVGRGATRMTLPVGSLSFGKT
jgi:hypothetical protein